MPTPQQDSRKQRIWAWIEAHAGFYVFGALLMVSAFFVLGMIIDRTSEPTSNDYLGKWTDYSHEIASAFLGAILTVAVTAFLLKMQEKSTAQLQREQIVSQAQVEREKEIGAKIFEEKLKIYGILLAGLEEFLQCERLENKNFTQLTLNCLHVSYIADYSVMCRLEHFTMSLLKIIQNDSKQYDAWDERRDGHDPISHIERKEILREFSEVASSIKTDLQEGVKLGRKDDLPEAERLLKTQSIIDNLADCDIAYADAEERLKQRKARGRSRLVET